MTRRGLFGMIAGLLGAMAVRKVPVEAAPEVIEEAWTNVIAPEYAPTDLTIESLERVLSEWRAE
jgi:hypothetical protein